MIEIKAQTPKKIPTDLGCPGGLEKSTSWAKGSPTQVQGYTSIHLEDKNNRSMDTRLGRVACPSAGVMNYLPLSVHELHIYSPSELDFLPLVPPCVQPAFKLFSFVVCSTPHCLNISNNKLGVIIPQFNYTTINNYSQLSIYACVTTLLNDVTSCIMNV